MAPTFTYEDVRGLANNPSDFTKARLIEKLSGAVSTDNLTYDEKLITEDILRMLAADISTTIREAVARKFSATDFLPHDIALKLAYDLEDVVAIPAIEKSVVLTDTELTQIVDESPSSRKKAVASRDKISTNLATHIAFNSTPEVVDALLRNNNVSLPQNICTDLFAHYSNDKGILKTLIQSKKIDLENAHDLLIKVSEDLRKMIIVEYNIPATTINNLIMDSKEWVTLSMLKAHAEQVPNSPSVGQIITKLQTENELSFTILIKGLSVGNIVFFEAALAKIAVTPLENIQKLLWEAANNEGFNAIYSKCQFPESMRDAMWALTKIVKEEWAAQSSEDITQRIHHRLLKAAKDNDIKNLDYLVTIVAHNIRKLKK